MNLNIIPPWSPFWCNSQYLVVTLFLSPFTIPQKFDPILFLSKKTCCFFTTINLKWTIALFLPHIWQLQSVKFNRSQQSVILCGLYIERKPSSVIYWDNYLKNYKSSVSFLKRQHIEYFRMRVKEYQIVIVNFTLNYCIKYSHNNINSSYAKFSQLIKKFYYNCIVCKINYICFFMLLCNTLCTIIQ